MVSYSSSHPAQPPEVLAGVRVVDLSRVLSGPYCTMILADLGAEVIKVERPPSGDDARAFGPPFVDGESTYFQSVNRSKASIALDLTQPAGAEVLWRLIDRADVLVENFRPGTMEALGFGPDVCLARQPGLVYARMSGFGQSGPERTTPGYDVIAQGMSGLMAASGEPDGPPAKAAFSVGDIGAGMWTAIGILAALLERTRSGCGQVVATTLLGGLVSWQAHISQAVLSAQAAPSRLGSAHASIVPYQRFMAQDRAFNLAVANDPQWHRLCAVVGQPQWANDQRFAKNRDRVTNRHQVIEQLDQIFRTNTADHWVRQCRQAEVPAADILRVEEVLAHPQLQAMGLIWELAGEHGPWRTVGSPLEMSRTPPRPGTTPPKLGQDTDQVLADLGYTDQEIRRMREDTVVS
ncbi:MAG: CaiB/BaiF CoA transferase family protein [Sulfobacillus sp.]